MLLGGASRRMGRDKAGIPVAGAPMATRVATTLSRVVEEVLLVGGTPPGDAPGIPVPDLEGPRCPLRGLASGLARASGERVLALAADLPLVTPDLLLALVAWPEADAVVPRTAEGLQPLCALYRREPALAAARTRLANGDLALHGLLDELETGILGPDDVARVDPDGRALTNVNTEEELTRAEVWLR